MSQISRTVNPIHFEDLEPHRFEDLVRQLMYDFKNWRQLEASGKCGGDNFFDDNIWLIQCKREKTINPSKIREYLEPLLKKNQIYEVIFVAACNFSEKSREVFRNICRDNNLQGFHLLGKCELEDLLFLHKKTTTFYLLILAFP